jgi:dTDP-glucose 4,6-dehydratase
MQFPEKIIPFFISQLIKRQKIPIYGDGQNIRDWLHVNDHCAGISLVIANGQPGQIYNLGGGKEITNIDLAKIILSELDMGTEFIKFVDDRKGHDFRYSVDCSRANRELGYIPKIDFNEGILKTIEWYLAHDFAKIQKR